MFDMYPAESKYEHIPILGKKYSDYYSIQRNSQPYSFQILRLHFYTGR